jgi:hypothetical protein
MSIKAKTGIDLCNNQLLNAVLENKATVSAPKNPIAGSFYWDTTNYCLKIYNGSAWVNYNPLDAYSFTKAADGVLQILRYINSSTSPTVENVTLVDTSNFDTAGAAAAAEAAAKIYTDNKISNLLGGTPSEALDTIYELAAAIEENQDLISSLQQLVRTGVEKSKVSCPALTPSSGVCTWVCNHGLTLNSWANDNTVMCDVYTSAGEKVLCDISINSAANVIIKIASDTTITAGSYYALFVG